MIGEYMTRDEKLSMLFDDLSDEVTITRTMLDRAEKSYNALGDYIKSYNDEWDVVVYPQGSFELGTVIKPLTEDEQYDVDLVVLIKSPKFSAEEIRSSVCKMLGDYGRYQGKIEDKKPCIRIQYVESAQFHMDIACAKEAQNSDDSIEIARWNGNYEYYYDPSNPKGYISWFKETMKYDEIKKRTLYEVASKTEVEELKLSRIRTPLQKAIQILKRHRDIYFNGRVNYDDRPSSIIITTLCAKIYGDIEGTFDMSNVYLTVSNLLKKFPDYIIKDENGDYYLENPSNTKENFLRKWKDNIGLVLAFDEWLRQAQQDIIENPESFIEDNPQKLRTILNESFGADVVEKAFDNYGKRIGEMAEKGKMFFDKVNAGITLQSSIGSAYKAHTYFGGNN